MKIPRALLFKYGCLSGKKKRETCWEIIHGYQLNFRNMASPQHLSPSFDVASVEGNLIRHMPIFSFPPSAFEE
jgi:hypothetical protein